MYKSILYILYSAISYIYITIHVIYIPYVYVYSIISMDAQCPIWDMGRNRPGGLIFMACSARATVLGHRARYTWYICVYMVYNIYVCIHVICVYVYGCIIIYLIDWFLVILFIEYIIDCAEKAESDGHSYDRLYYFLYLLLCILSFGSAMTGIVYMYSHNSDPCPLNMFFVSITLIIGILSIFISILSTVNRGLLTPCLVLTYSTFMCW